MLLHVSVCEQAGVACEVLHKVEPSTSWRLYWSFWLRNACNNAMCRAELVGLSILLSLLRFSLMHQSRGEGCFDALKGNFN
jgi:hypothetical protein